MIEERPHYSASQIITYERCAEQYRRRYIEGDKIPPGISLLRGTAVHKGRELNLKFRVDADEYLSLSEVVDCSRDEMKGKLQEEVRFTKEEKNAGIGIIKGRAIDETVNCAAADYKEFQTRINPAKVETEVRAEIRDFPRDILGFIDVIDRAGHIIDLKTTGRNLTQKDADASEQLSLYSLFYRKLEGIIEKGLYLQVVKLNPPKKDGTRSIKTYDLFTRRGPEDHQAMLNRLWMMNKAIEAGVFMPTTRDNWVCDPKWCGYYETCPHIKGKVQKGYEG